MVLADGGVVKGMRCACARSCKHTPIFSVPQQVQHRSHSTKQLQPSRLQLEPHPPIRALHARVLTHVRAARSIKLGEKEDDAAGRVKREGIRLADQNRERMMTGMQWCKYGITKFLSKGSRRSIILGKVGSAQLWYGCCGQPCLFLHGQPCLFLHGRPCPFLHGQPCPFLHGWMRGPGSACGRGKARGNQAARTMSAVCARARARACAKNT